MAEDLDDTFRMIVRDITKEIKRYSKRDQRAVAGWLQQVGKEVQTNEEKQARNDFGRYLRYFVQLGEKLPDDVRQPMCTKDFRKFGKSSATSKGQCPRKDVIAELTSILDKKGIRGVIDQVLAGEITTAVEYIFSIGNYVEDNGLLFRKILEKDLSLFREIVTDTVDRRIQDEADVMMHTQNDIKQKFQTLTEAMTQRTGRIRQRLLEISPKFDWIADGKNKAKISKLVTNKQREMSSDLNTTEKLIYQVFMRSRWLKKEFTRLHEENSNLKKYLDKFQRLAAERKVQSMHIPRILCEEKKELEKELAVYRNSYKKNLEIINALYVEHNRCVKPQDGFCDE